MTYLSWAAMFEGSTDRTYFEVLIPRLMEAMTLAHGTRNSTIPLNPVVILPRGASEKVAQVACDQREAFHLVFIHADTGGRNLEAGLARRSCAICNAMTSICDWPAERCIVVAPRKETEAWLLADPQAITSALGYTGLPDTIGLPAHAKAAEALADPKVTLNDAMKQVRGRRAVNIQQIYPAIAQLQSWDALRRSDSFRKFESDLRVALAHIGCVTAEP
jgi:Domain of unknown function (DUF4276)